MQREKLEKGSRARLSRYSGSLLPVSWCLHRGGTGHPLANSSLEPRAHQILHLLPSPRPPAQGRRQVNLPDTTAMLRACLACHNANPDTSHSPSVRNTETICQNSATHAESEKNRYYCKLHSHYLSNELSAVGIQFISTLPLVLSFQ